MKKIILSLLIMAILLGVFVAVPTGTAYTQSGAVIPNNNTWQRFEVRNDTTEYYDINIPSTGRVRLSFFLATYDGYVRCKIYDNDYETCLHNSGYDVDSNKPCTFTEERILTKGTYHIMLEIGSESGYVKIKSNYKNYNCNTKDNSTYDRPNTLVNGKTSVGAFTYTNNDTAWYKISISSKKIVQLKFFAYTDQVRFTLYNSSLNKEYYQTEVWWGSESSPSSDVMKLKLNRGTYYLKVDQRWHDGLYKINYQSYARPRLNCTKTTVKVGKTKQLKVSGGTGKIIWRSSRRKIAAVSAGGKIVGKKKGSCVITAKRNGFTMNCTVKVK